LKNRFHISWIYTLNFYIMNPVLCWHFFPSITFWSVLYADMKYLCKVTWPSLWFPGYRSRGLGCATDFQRCSGSRTGSTQSHEYSWGATWKKSSGCGLEIENMAVGICHADHVASSIRKKLALISPTSGGRSVGIVRSRTQATEFLFLM
jgi:hypothetical protein